MKIFEKIKIDEFIAGLSLLLIILLITVNVILRYAFNFILNWAEELATASFVWCVFISAAIAYRENRHIAIDIIVNFLPKTVYKVLDIIINLFLLCLNSGITYLSILLCISSRNKPTPILRIPYSYINLALTVGFGLMVVYGIAHLVKKIKNFKET